MEYERRALPTAWLAVLPMVWLGVLRMAWLAVLPVALAWRVKRGWQVTIHYVPDFVAVSRSKIY
jgi:hypothetical protein